MALLGAAGGCVSDGATIDRNAPIDETPINILDIKPIDTQATEQTVKLLRNLFTIGQSDFFIFGQAFPTDFSYIVGVNDDSSQSDCKDIVSDHPGVHGDRSGESGTLSLGLET